MRDQDAVTMATVTVGGQTLLMLPEKAAFLPGSDTLLVADAHLGKTVSPRKLGGASQGGSTVETLAVLSQLVKRFEVRRIVFLGNFLHSPRSKVAATMEAVSQWREEHALLELQLVRDSHHERPAEPPSGLGIETFYEPLVEGGLAFCHHPRPLPGVYALGGHLHPCISVGGRAQDWLRMPCFWYTHEFGVLPAFGAFTGMQTIRPNPSERVFAATPERVFELSPTRRKA